MKLAWNGREMILFPSLKHRLKSPAPTPEGYPIGTRDPEHSHHAAPCPGMSCCKPFAMSAPSATEPETKGLSLLLVEDDQMSREMLLLQLEGLFTRIFAATDGTEGLRFFCEYTPDIVLTDQIMPGLSGLDLVRNIHATGGKPSVVLMTSAIDNQVLLEAINIGVERFIPKPFDFNQIIRTLTSIAREIVNVRIQEQHRQQEVELLRYRDSYNSMQQESARRKERHVVRHDLRNQVLTGAGGVRWGINVAYLPHDILCGDGYSVRNLFDGRQFIFIVDAMGSGMSASLTAMLATSFFNYQVENLHKWGKFTLRIFLTRFKEYLTSMLLEEEVLSCGFLLIDLAQEEIKTAIFALPPLLVRGLDGSVRRVRGENPPIGIYPGEVKIGTLSLSGVADLLVMTDGVTDAPMIQGGSYREAIEGDFRAAPTITAQQRRFREKTERDDLDDLTVLHLRRLDFDSGWKWREEPELTPQGVHRAIREFLDALAMEVELNSAEHDALAVTLTEALSNALKHGCPKMARSEQPFGRQEEANTAPSGKAAAEPDAAIVLSATLWRGAEMPLLLMEVRDSGPGLPDEAFNADTTKTFVKGRGLRMISRFSDSVFLGRPGGRLIILKAIEGETAHEHCPQQQ